MTPDDCLASDRKPDPLVAPSAADHSPLAEQYRAWVASLAEARANIAGAQRWLKLIEASPEYSNEVKAIYRAELQCGGQHFRNWLSDIAAFPADGISPVESMCNYGYESPLWPKLWPILADPPDVSSGPAPNAFCRGCTFGLPGQPKPVPTWAWVSYTTESGDYEFKPWRVPPGCQQQCVIASFAPCVRMIAQPHVELWEFEIEPGRIRPSGE